MKLNSLLKELQYKTKNFRNVNITNLSIHSRDITKNGLFFAINGNKYNGEDYVEEAIKNGAVAVICENELLIDIPQVIVKDIRKCMAIISKVFFNKCDEKLKIIAVVGTNGKTTSATLIRNILQESGKKVGIIGTNGIFINELQLPNKFTTPDPIELFYTFEQMLAFGVEYVVIEVSAHAIYYNKVYGIKPEVILYTNISNEHLDFFKNMDNYKQVKLGYLKQNPNSITVVNVDDEGGREVLKATKRATTYGLANPADVFAIDIKLSFNGTEFVCNAMDEILNIKSHLVGDYNVYNLLGVIAVAKVLKISPNYILSGIEKTFKIDGRMEVFDFSNNNKVIVDYAHTPDGFEKILSTVKSFRNGRIITLFGCVGYSDRNKRKLMGDIVKKYSDFVVISSDNFSDEKFEEIYNDIGIYENVKKIQNRASAVDYAIKMLNKNDTLLLLGKGNEDTQKSNLGDVKYNEIEYVKSYL